MKLHDTSAVVTGGASGLGASTAARLSKEGAHVFAFDLASSIEKSTPVGGVTYVPVDVTDADQVRTSMATANDDQRYPLRTIVNCAGIAPSSRILGRDGVHDLALYAKVIQVNLIGTFNCLALGAEQISTTAPFDDGQRGVIVNTASVAAFEGQVGQTAYAASKAGVVGLGLPAARDLASVGIRVNTIAPGIIDTPMLATLSKEFRDGLAAGVPFPKRLGQPEEYADVVAFLVDHDYLNGETIRMDGALRMAPR